MRSIQLSIIATECVRSNKSNLTVPLFGTCILSTVFPRIDAAAFIYFVVEFGAATIRGRRLFEGSVYYFGQYDRATYTASLASSPSNYVVWLLQKLIEKYNNSQWARICKCRSRRLSALISRRFAAKRYTRDEDNGEDAFT